jgi:hypothetical protein
MRADICVVVRLLALQFVFLRHRGQYILLARHTCLEHLPSKHGCGVVLKRYPGIETASLPELVEKILRQPAGIEAAT